MVCWSGGAAFPGWVPAVPPAQPAHPLAFRACRAACPAGARAGQQGACRGLSGRRMRYPPAFRVSA